MLTYDETRGRQQFMERSASLVGVTEALLDKEHSAGVIALPAHRLHHLEHTGALEPYLRTKNGLRFEIAAFLPSQIPKDPEERDHLVWTLRQHAILDYRRLILSTNIGATEPVQARFIESLAMLPMDALCGDDSQLSEWLKGLIVESRSAPIALAGVHPEAVAPGSDVLTGHFRAVDDRLTAGDIVGPFVFNQQDDYVFGI